MKATLTGRSRAFYYPYVNRSSTHLNPRELIVRMTRLAVRLTRWVSRWIWALKDSLPPYGVVEGQLETKEPGPDEKYLVCVSSTWVEVDRQTYDTLVVGENLRVRYTRGSRAVNIDRLLSRRGPG